MFKSNSTRKPATKAAKGKATKRPANPDAIATVTTAKGGGHVAVISAGSEMFTRPVRGDSKEFRAIAMPGLSFNAAQRWHEKNPVAKPQAKLASGITPKDAPHSAKAVADQKATPATKGKGDKARTAKASKAKAPARGTERTYKVGSTKIAAKPDTWRGHMLGTIVKHSDTAKAKAAHAKSGKFSANKLDFNWANAQGYIKFDK